MFDFLNGQFLFTASVNKQHFQWLFSLLDRYCQEGKTVALEDRFGRIWSLQKNNGSTHFVVSTAFHQNLVNEPQRTVFAITHENVKKLGKVDNRVLMLIASKLKIPIGIYELPSFLRIFRKFTFVYC